MENYIAKWREEEFRLALRLAYKFIPESERHRFFAAWDQYRLLRQNPGEPRKNKPNQRFKPSSN